MKSGAYSSIAYCTWSWRIAPGYPWQKQEGDTAICRASVGARIVSVWLPRGALIRMRLSRGGETTGNFRHVFGRDRDNLIEIHIPDAIVSTT